MQFKNFNYYGFNHSAVDKKFGGELTFVCEMPIPLMTKHGPIPTACAVYHAAKPDRTKGHKDYMLLFSQGETYMVSGRDEKEMEAFWTIPAVVCKACGDVLVSIDRHHFNRCSCKNETFVDGGMWYQRVGAVDLSQIENVLIDMRTKEIVY